MILVALGRKPPPATVPGVRHVNTKEPINASHLQATTVEGLGVGVVLRPAGRNASTEALRRQRDGNKHCCPVCPPDGSKLMTKL